MGPRHSRRGIFRPASKDMEDVPAVVKALVSTVCVGFFLVLVSLIVA